MSIIICVSGTRIFSPFRSASRLTEHVARSLFHIADADHIGAGDVDVVQESHADVASQHLAQVVDVPEDIGKSEHAERIDAEVLHVHHVGAAEVDRAHLQRLHHRVFRAELARVVDGDFDAAVGLFLDEAGVFLRALGHGMRRRVQFGVAEDYLRRDGVAEKGDTERRSADKFTDAGIHDDSPNDEKTTAAPIRTGRLRWISGSWGGRRRTPPALFYEKRKDKDLLKRYL